MMAAVQDRPTLPSENDFWDTPPRYSTVSELPIEPSPLPQPSLLRLMLSRFLFVAILAAIAAPFVYRAMSP
jgi:hypothetical protein